MSFSKSTDDFLISLVKRLDNQEKELMCCREELSQLRRWKLDTKTQFNNVDHLNSEIERLDNTNMEFSTQIAKLSTKNQQLCNRNDRLSLELHQHEKRVDDLQSVFNNIIINTQHDDVYRQLEILKTKVNDLVGTTRTQTSLSPIPATTQRTSAQRTSAQRTSAQRTSARTSALLPSASSSPSPPPLQPHNSLQETMDHINSHSTAGLPLAQEVWTYEMFVSGRCSSWPTSAFNTMWRLNNYNYALAGDALRKYNYDFDCETGTVSYHGYRNTFELFCFLEARQIGSGSMIWYLCTNKKPVQEYIGGRYGVKESVDQGQIFCLKMLTTCHCKPTGHSRMVFYMYDCDACIWVEVERSCGDAVVAECRFYGGRRL